MKKLIIEAQKLKPMVIFSIENNLCRLMIAGKSAVVDPHFYDQLEDWIHEYIKNPVDSTELILAITYSSSADDKRIFEIIELIKNVNLKIICYFEEGDEDREEHYRDLKEVSNVEYFETKEVKDVMNFSLIYGETFDKEIIKVLVGNDVYTKEFVSQEKVQEQKKYYFKLRLYDLITDNVMLKYRTGYLSSVIYIKRFPAGDELVSMMNWIKIFILAPEKPESLNLIFYIEKGFNKTLKKKIFSLIKKVSYPKEVLVYWYYAEDDENSFNFLNEIREEEKDVLWKAHKLSVTKKRVVEQPNIFE